MFVTFLTVVCVPKSDSHTTIDDAFLKVHTIEELAFLFVQHAGVEVHDTISGSGICTVHGVSNVGERHVVSGVKEDENFSLHGTILRHSVANDAGVLREVQIEAG